ncbi:MAG: nitroreductase [Flavobacteriales bacterium]
MKYNLSEITAVIQDRRTIAPEFFGDRKVPREIVEKILNNAIWAPNHGMTQPWRFKVFMGDSIAKFGEAHAELYKASVNETDFDPGKYSKLKDRPLLSSVIIAICMKRNEAGKIPEIEEVEAVACAVQNMYLTCTAYGLASYWGSGGMTYSEGMKEYLGLGAQDKCLGFFYIGYPKGEWPKGQRRPIEYVTDWME